MRLFASSSAPRTKKHGRKAELTQLLTELFNSSIKRLRDQPKCSSLGRGDEVLFKSGIGEIASRMTQMKRTMKRRVGET